MRLGVIAGEIVVALGLFASCGGSDGGAGHVEISGKTPDEGAAIAAQAVCMREAQCGGVEIACSSGGAAGGGGGAGTVQTSCSGTITHVVYDKCYGEASSDLTKLLSCPSLTPEQVNTLETCFDTLIAEPCVTQAEADAQARAEEAGGMLTPTALPAACDLLRHAPAGC